MTEAKHYRLRPRFTPSMRAQKKKDDATMTRPSSETAAFVRAKHEDDDGYDPYSDRPPTKEPLFEEDPWK